MSQSAKLQELQSVLILRAFEVGGQKVLIDLLIEALIRSTCCRSFYRRMCYAGWYALSGTVEPILTPFPK